MNFENYFERQLKKSKPVTASNFPELRIREDSFGSELQIDDVLLYYIFERPNPDEDNIIRDIRFVYERNVERLDELEYVSQSIDYPVFKAK